MIIKDRIVRLDPEEFIIRPESPFAKDIKVYYKGVLQKQCVGVIMYQVDYSD